MFNKNGQKDRTLDASDLVSVFAAAVLKSANASGKDTRFSNWVGNNLNGAISDIEEISDQYLIETTACGTPHIKNILKGLDCEY